MKGKKVVGAWSSGKDKQRVITIGSNGELLPPFLIFKTSKPRNKSFKDYPSNETPTFDSETTAMAQRAQVVTLQNYTAWNNARIMKTYYAPYFSKYVTLEVYWLWIITLRTYMMGLLKHLIKKVLIIFFLLQVQRQYVNPSIYRLMP